MKIHTRRKILVSTIIHQKLTQEFNIRKCPLEFTHFEKKCRREFIVHEKSPSSLIQIKFVEYQKKIRKIDLECEPKIDLRKEQAKQIRNYRRLLDENYFG